MSQSIKGWRHLKFWKHTYPKIITHMAGDGICAGQYFPPDRQWFAALRAVPFDKVKVVILGQDPYFKKGLAHGYAFSVPPDVSPVPRSLRNLLTEYENDLGYPTPRNGDLRVWAERGCLLLNTILTVEEGKPLSHRGIGWEKLSYEIVRSLATQSNVVFILLGKKAQEYSKACEPCPFVTAPHPSARDHSFPGCKIFSRANEELKKLGIEFDWRLP